MTEPFPQMKLDPWQIYSDAMTEHRPVKVFALVSGGNDSTVLLSWANQQIGKCLDAAVFIDTGTALPGVREFVTSTCKEMGVPLLVYEAGDAYAQMVRDHGFPGPAGHRYAYVRLKERQVDRLIREHKTQMRDRIMLLTGVRRAESTRRMGTTDPVRRDGATVWVAPLIDWTAVDMREYRESHGTPESDVAAFMHRSGECNCGAFATDGEREMLRSSYPAWWKQHIAPLEEATGRKWGERPLSELPVVPTGDMCSSCDVRQLALEEAA